MQQRSFVVTIEYEGNLDSVALEDYLHGALDAYIGQHPRVEYLDHDIYEESDTV